MFHICQSFAIHPDASVFTAVVFLMHITPDSTRTLFTWCHRPFPVRRHLQRSLRHRQATTKRCTCLHPLNMHTLIAMLTGLISLCRIHTRRIRHAMVSPASWKRLAKELWSMRYCVDSVLLTSKSIWCKDILLSLNRLVFFFCLILMCSGWRSAEFQFVDVLWFKLLMSVDAEFPKLFGTLTHCSSFVACCNPANLV